MSVVNKEMDLGYSKRKSEILQEWAGTGKKILDVGCYDGRDTVTFIQKGNEVYGIEVLEEPALKAREKGVSVEVFDIDKCETWPYEDSFFDIVIAGDIVEHVIDVDRFMQNAHRVLKPEGHLYISTPNLGSIGRRLLLLLGKNPFIEVSWRDEVNGFPAVGHVRYFTKGSLQSLLEHSGFTVEDITSDAFNFGPIHSTLLGRLFPGLSWRFIVKAFRASRN